MMKKNNKKKKKKKMKKKKMKRNSHQINWLKESKMEDIKKWPF